MGSGHRRIAAVPFTLKNLKEDLEDLGSRFDGAPDLEFRAATKALELEQSGLSYQRVPPGYRFPYGHTHKKQEEVYVVVRGSGRMKLDDEIVELKEWDVVRVPRYVARLRGRTWVPRDHRHRRAASSAHPLASSPPSVLTSRDFGQTGPKMRGEQAKLN
jgi:hypothetical protein